MTQGSDGFQFHPQSGSGASAVPLAVNCFSGVPAAPSEIGFFAQVFSQCP
jgi:hypothetical protein